MALFLLGCQSNKNFESIVRLEINPKTASKLDLDEWFKKIELIALETTPESVIAEINKVVFFGNRYYILDRRQNAIFVYDQKGQFIFHTKSLAGRGPGEYNRIIDFNINEAKEQLEILDPPSHKIMVYSLNGEYLNFINLKELISPTNFSAVTSDIYGFYSYSKQENLKHLALYSVSEEMIIKTLHTLPLTLEHFAHPSTRPFLKYNGMIQFKHTVPSNQIFIIDSQTLDLKEYIKFNFGKFNFSSTEIPENKERRFYTHYIESYSNKYAFPIETVEIKCCIYHFFFFNSKIFIAKYNKTNEEVAVRFSEYADLEQFSPTTFANDSVLFNVFSPNTVRYYISESLLDEKSIKILETIKKSDNPLIVIYTPID